MLRRLLLTMLAVAFVAQPAMAQSVDAPVQAESSASESEDGWDGTKAAFALTTAGVGVALGVASSNSSAAGAPSFVVPSSDTYGGHLGSTGGPVAKQVAVPEPGTFGLTLAGMLGLFGVVVLRRRSVVKV